nr:MAG TPA: hypothetical protein [Caudoviricetes sp.]
MIELVHLGEFPSVGAVWLRYPQGGREGDYVTIGGVRHVWNKYRMCWGGASDLVKDARRKTIIEGDLDVYNDMTVGGFLRSRFGVHGGDVGTWVDEVKQALADIRASRGRAGGVAPLDEYGTVPSKHLPSQAKFEQDLRRDLADSVSPTTLRVMRILQGDPSLQFVFIQSMVSAVRVDHVVSYDKASRVLKVPEGVIQHLTLGIDAIRPNRPLKDYRRWSVPALSWSVGGDEVRTLYLYAKVIKEGSTGEFVVTDKAVGLEGEAGYYMLLVGMLSAPPDRVFSKLYGFSEYLPGLIRIERLESPDGEFVIDLVRKTIQGGEVTFKSGGAVDDRLNEIINEARGYTDRKRDELKSYTDSKSEGGRRYADSKADAVRRDAERRAQEVSDEARGYTDGKLKEGKDYTDRVLTEAKEELKRGFVDTGEMNRRFAELQKQIDKEVSNWYYPGAPDRDKDPEKNWGTKEERDKHVGDTYTSTDDPPSPHAGKSWRYTNDHTWKSIVDSDSLKALKLASEAKAAADGKTTTYFEKPTKYKRGDSWVLTQAEEVGGKSYPRGVTLYSLQDADAYESSHWVRLDEYISSVEAKEYADGKASDALEKSKGYSDEADKKVRKRMDEQSSATLKGAKEYADGKDDAVRRDAQTGAEKAKEDAIAEADKKDRAVIDHSNRAIDKAKEDLRTYTNDKVKEVSDGMATYDYLRRSILEGDTKVYGGLVLSNLLAARDVARGGIRSFISGTPSLPAFASGVSDFGTPGYKAVVEINHDGTGHIGNMHIEEGGSVITFVPSAQGGAAVRIGGSQVSLNDLINSSEQDSSTTRIVKRTVYQQLTFEREERVLEIDRFGLNVQNDGSAIYMEVPWNISVEHYNTNSQKIISYAIVKVQIVNSAEEVVYENVEYLSSGNYGTHYSSVTYPLLVQKFGLSKGLYTVSIIARVRTEFEPGSPMAPPPAYTVFKSEEFTLICRVMGVNESVRESVFSNKGVCLFFGRKRFLFINGEGGDRDTFMAVHGNTDMPGVLLAGQVNTSDGRVEFDRVWGAFSGGCSIQRVSTGTYRITHNIGHYDYIVVANSIGAGAQTAAASRITDTAFDITTKHFDESWNIINFSFIVVGDNYKG